MHPFRDSDVLRAENARLKRREAKLYRLLRRSFLWRPVLVDIIFVLVLTAFAAHFYAYYLEKHCCDSVQCSEALHVPR